MNPNSVPQIPAPKQGGNAIMAFLQVKRTVPTWAIILGIVLALSLGHATGSSASTSDGTTTTAQTTQSSTSGSTTTPKATATTAPKPTATSAPKVTTIVSYSGTSGKNTPNFHVRADQWQITWACQPGQIGGNFIVSLYSADGTEVDPAAVNVICSTSQHDVTIERGSGDFYFQIIADATWQIQVQAVQ